MYLILLRQTHLDPTIFASPKNHTLRPRELLSARDETYSNQHFTPGCHGRRRLGPDPGRPQNAIEIRRFFRRLFDEAVFLRAFPALNLQRRTNVFHYHRNKWSERLWVFGDQRMVAPKRWTNLTNHSRELGHYRGNPADSESLVRARSCLVRQRHWYRYLGAGNSGYRPRADARRRPVRREPSVFIRQYGQSRCCLYLLDESDAERVHSGHGPALATRRKCRRERGHYPERR